MTVMTYINNSSHHSNRKERFNNEVEVRMMMDGSFAASCGNEINEERELRFCKGLSVEDVFEKVKDLLMEGDTETNDYNYDINNHDSNKNNNNKNWYKN